MLYRNKFKDAWLLKRTENIKLLMAPSDVLKFQIKNNENKLTLRRKARKHDMVRIKKRSFI